MPGTCYRLLQRTTTLALCGLLGASACGGDGATSGSNGGGGSGASSTGGSGSGGSDGGGGGSTVPEYHGSVSGQVVDEDGNPLATLGVSLCFTVCRIVDTDAAGMFSFEDVDPGTQVIENIGLPTDDSVSAALVYTKFFDFVTVGVDETIVIDRPFVVRKVDTDGPYTGPQQLSLQAGLEVGFDADVFGTPDNPLPSPAMELYFGATEIPQQDWPVHGHDGWTILRAWGFAVWDLHHENEFAVAAALGDAGPLPADSEVAFLVADYTYGFVNGIFFEEEAVLSADGTSLSTPANGGLDRSTMLLAVVRDGS